MNQMQFAARVFKTNTHWYWTAALNGHGYGNIHRGGKCRYAHRIAFELFNGPLEATDEVLHECDIPHCVNPNHLWRGTHADNMADAAKKKRFPVRRGEDNHKAKLTHAQVMLIKSDPRKGSDLAKLFGVSQSLISHIRVGRNWRHTKESAN